jgi:hypothetical protein
VATDGATSVAAADHGGKRDSGGGATAKPSSGNDGASASSLSGLIPSLSDAPKGEVTLGANAGAFGPWRAHQVIDAIAREIAGSVTGKLPMLTARVLVVGDRSVLAGDWTARQVGYTLTRLEHRLEALRKQLKEGREKLEEDILGLTEAESATNATRPVDPSDSSHPQAAHAEDLAEPPAKDAAGVPGALDSAVDLLDLIRTDYTLTASAVTPGPAELVTLTAAHLAKLGVRVESDVLAVAGDSPSLEKFSDLLGKRDKAVESLFELERDLASVGDWPAGGAARVAGQARALTDYARQVISDVDTAASALTRAPRGGQSPLYVAACRERLAKGGVAGITHVLYVNLDSVAADAVTRRSVLGASGILRFLAAGNASWLLLDTDKGILTAGSQQSHADVLSFSLVTGQATFNDGPSVPRTASPLSDPTAFTERAAKMLVVALVVLLAIIGILSLIAVARIAIY